MHERRLTSLLWQVRQNEILFRAVRELRDLKSYAQGLRRGTFSQHGEDLLVEQLLGRRRGGFYIDIGASHPFRISNTYLLYRRGWSGISVEPIPSLGRLHRRWRPRDTLVPAAIGPEAGKLTFFEMLPSVLSTLDPTTAERYTAEGKARILKTYSIRVITPMQFFREHVAERTIDFLSMDIEGLDLRTLHTIDLMVVRPRLLCVELNDASETEALVSHLNTFGYFVIKVLGCNLICASKESGVSLPAVPGTPCARA
jgi:FkbM family methyltransferase